jgi:hypothetical protein
MATVKFNNIILEVFQRLKDPIANATLDGTTYSNKIVRDHCNRAIRDFLIAQITGFGERGFSEAYPEYVKTGSALTLVAGTIAKPTDCFTILDLYAGAVLFTKLEQYQVAGIVNGSDPVIIPSATSPVFWEEGSNIYTLGITSGNVIPRYIITHQDITPTINSSTAGNWGSTGTFTAATNTLVATMNSSFASVDVNKKIFFRSTTTTYAGYIQSYTNATTVVLGGNNLPSSDIATVQIIVSDASPDSTDLLLNPYWYGEVVERTYMYSVKDSKNSVIQ